MKRASQCITQHPLLIATDYIYPIPDPVSSPAATQRHSLKFVCKGGRQFRIMPNGICETAVPCLRRIGAPDGGPRRGFRWRHRIKHSWRVSDRQTTMLAGRFSWSRLRDPRFLGSLGEAGQRWLEGCHAAATDHLRNLTQQKVLRIVGSLRLQKL